MNEVLELLSVPGDLIATDADTDETVLARLVDRRVVLVVDWSGEEEPGQIGRFCQSRADALAAPAGYDHDKVYAALDRKIARGEVERGDAVPFLLDRYHRDSKKTGLALSVLDRGDDAWWVVLTRAAEAKRLAKLTGFWAFRPYTRKRGEILYVVNCECGGMDVWQLKRTDPAPADERCGTCGRLVFDEQGTARQPVETSLI